MPPKPAQPTRQVITRRMGDPPVEAVPVSRKPGERVGLTREQILAAAKRSIASRAGALSIKAVAAELGVAHNSISSRLRRDKTTLDLELAKDFLAAISRPMLPREDWRVHLREMFVDALRECDAHPGLARVVTPWLAQSPMLSPDFTERVFHVLASAGLRDEAGAEHLDLVLAPLCGMLSVRFPDFGKHPKAWAEAIAGTLQGVQERQHPLLYRAREKLALAAKQKAAGRKPSPTGKSQPAALLAAGVAIRSIEGMVSSVDPGNNVARC